MTKTEENLSKRERRGDYVRSKNKTYHQKLIQPDLIETCLLCDNQIKIKYIPPKRRYSLKNNWGYWTGKKIFQNKYACNNCLVNIHKGGIINWVSDLEKADIFYTYLSRKTLHSNS
jgi:hypothetical protein